MKFVVIVIGLVAFVTALEQEIFKIPQDKAVRIKKISDQCALDNNVDPGLLPRVVDGTIPEDEASNKYLYCFAVKIGVLSEDGHFIANKMADILGNHPLVEKFREAISKCNEITKENHLATVMAMNRCYINTVPVRFAV